VYPLGGREAGGASRAEKPRRMGCHTTGSIGQPDRVAKTAGAVAIGPDYY
jgi:hypothetical protein